MDTTCTRILEWDAAHRVMRHESKCATLHGHRYRAEITCSAKQLDGVGRVIDFGVIKELIGSWVDENWDHTTLINTADARLRDWCDEEHKLGKRPPFFFQNEPTAEVIAAFLLEKSQLLLKAAGHPIRVEKVRVFETPNCFAEAHA